MKRASLLLYATWLLHAVAWCVPVHRYGVSHISFGRPGIEAFTVALFENFHPWYLMVLGKLSAVSTVLLIGASPLVFRWGSPKWQRVAAWIAAVSFVLNAHWMAEAMPNVSDLRAGYYLWWISFALLAVGFFALAKNEKTLPAKSLQATAG